MSFGTVKFFNVGKGFGFVTPDDGGPDIFLPSASVTSSGLKCVKPGQRVMFEQAPDARGPKIVSLKAIAEAPPDMPVSAAEQVTVFCDLSSPAAAEVVKAVSAGGFQAVPLDYMATPVGIEQLRRLSHQVNEAGQTLVRRYDPLFSALQLDDRFIGIQDFWTGIVEHPALINGPVLVRGAAARICKSASEARAFLSRGGADKIAGPKTLSPRMAALLRGEALPPSASRSDPERPVREPPPEAKARKLAAKSRKAAPEPPAKPKKKAPQPAAKKAAKKPAARKAGKPVTGGKPAKKKTGKR